VARQGDPGQRDVEDDGRPSNAAPAMPFDRKRLVYGGFEPIVELA
jgi:uncharacterized protein YbaA (DUF1428 family)